MHDAPCCAFDATRCSTNIASPDIRSHRITKPQNCGSFDCFSCFVRMSTPGGDSRLDDSALEFVGRPVAARTIYGWGWAEGHDDRTDSVPVDVPPSFHFRVVEFCDWNGERRGGIGHIDQAGHIYDGHWLLFYTRVCGCFDFVLKIADYNFHIGRNRPSLYRPTKDPMMAKAWPLPRFVDCSSVWGYGQIAATLDAIERFERERLERWQRESSSS